MEELETAASKRPTGDLRLDLGDRTAATSAAAAIALRSPTANVLATSPTSASASSRGTSSEFVRSIIQSFGRCTKQIVLSSGSRAASRRQACNKRPAGVGSSPARRRYRTSRNAASSSVWARAPGDRMEGCERGAGKKARFFGSFRRGAPGPRRWGHGDSRADHGGVGARAALLASQRISKRRGCRGIKMSDNVKLSDVFLKRLK